MANTLQSIKDSIDNLEAAIAITALGRLSQHFLPPTTFLEILLRVQPHLKQGNSFLTGLTIEKIYPYYDLCQVHLATMGPVIRLFVRVPIKETNKFFKLYKVVPLPYHLPGSSAAIIINPNNDFLAVTQDGQYHVEINSVELEYCQKTTLTICVPMTPIRKSHAKSCLFALYTGNTEEIHSLCEAHVVLRQPPVFFRTPTVNSWAYSVTREPLTIHCPDLYSHDNASVTQRTLIGSGTIDIPPSCETYGGDFILASHTSNVIQISKDPTFSVPPLASILNIITNNTHKDIPSTLGTISQMNDIINTFERSHGKTASVPFRKWQEQLQILNTPLWYNNTTYHNIGGTCVGIICLLIMIFCIWKRKYCCRNMECYKVFSARAGPPRVPRRPDTHKIEHSGQDALYGQLQQPRPLALSGRALRVMEIEEGQEGIPLQEFSHKQLYPKLF